MQLYCMPYETIYDMEATNYSKELAAFLCPNSDNIICSEVSSHERNFYHKENNFLCAVVIRKTPFTI